MSTMKICPKCNGEQFKVNLVAEGVVSIAVTENGSEYQLISQGDLGIDNSVLVCTSCGEQITEDVLVDGMMSEVSNKYFPIDQLVQVELEGGAVQIMTNAEYEAMSAPSIETMSEEQLRETAKSQQAALEQMQAQIQQLMAQMQTGVTPAPTQTAPEPQAPVTQANAPVATPTPTQAPAQAQVQAPSIPTNLTPAENPVNVIDPSTIQPEETINAGNFFGAEAPF